MARRMALALILLVVGSAHGQHSNLIPSASTPAAPTAPASNAVPMTASGAAGVLVQGANHAQENARDAVNTGMDVRTILKKKPDKGLARAMDAADKWGDSAGHIVGAVEAYRENGAEGMAIYGTQELAERVFDAAVERAVGPAAPAWRVGRTLGELVRDISIGGDTIQGHVTNMYFNNLHGRWANEEFEQITSEEAIDRHRQKLRQQRFQTMNAANEQAAANRAATTAQPATAGYDPAFANEMMLMMLPAIAAQQQRTIQPPRAAPATPSVSDPCPQGQFQNWKDGRCYAWGDVLGRVPGTAGTPERNPYLSDINGRRVEPAVITNPPADPGRSSGPLRAVPGHR